MKVLLVEDDENKSSQILQFVDVGLGIRDVRLARSYRGGLEKILNEHFDIVLLDMTLPTYEGDLDEEGGRPRVFAGRDILRQMDRKNVKAPVIVVTQFDKFGEHGETRTRDQLDRELLGAHPSIYRGMVYYNSGLEGWKEELAARIEAIQQSNRL